MHNKSLFLTTCLMLVAWSAVAAASNPVKQVTAITEVFGDGQQVTAVVLQYDRLMDGNKLKPSSYSVREIVPPEMRQHGREALTEPVYEDRQVARVYTNTEAAFSEKSVKGEYVIVELVKTYHYLPTFGGGPTGGQRPQGPQTGDKVGQMQRGERPQGGVSKTMPQRDEILGSYKGITRIEDFKAEVTQVARIKDAKGRTLAAGAPVVSDKTINLIVDDFAQFEYKDEMTGIPLAYNLFIPKDYDPAKKYPLVLFMPDATVTGKETTRTLTQGIGATIWASPEEQAKHPCFVLAPDYTQQIMSDNWVTNDYLDATVGLVNYLARKYSIDTDRMYTTGQSGGCMLSFAIDNKYPELFAASLLMAGKWDNSRVSRFAHQKMWMMCGDGDKGALPSMTGIVAELKKQGVKVSEAVWNGRSTPEEFDALCKAIDAEGADIRFVHFPQYTVFPDDDHIDGMEHLQTWRLTYTIEGVRDWLFRQSK